MTPKQKYARLTVLCTAVYFTSYISRINLAAVMVELIQSGFAEKQVAALALTLCSVTYGVGQVLSGWQGTSLIWAAIAAAGAVICLSSSRQWKNFRHQETE